MTPIKLDVTKLVENREAKLQQQLAQRYAAGAPPLTVVSFYNQDDPPSEKYSKMKQAAAGRVGINFEIIPYQKSTSHSDLAQLIEAYATDTQVQGVMLQLPVPDELNILQDDLIVLIPPSKDVDGLIPHSPYTPAVACAVKTICDNFVPDWKNLSVAILGARGTAGSAILKLIQNREVADVVGIDLNTTESDRRRVLKHSELVISATGHEDQLDPTEFSDGFVWINVGGGLPNPELIRKTSLYTPRFGGVGPMTVQMLLENSYQTLSSHPA